jgi:hypothetical protein
VDGSGWAVNGRGFRGSRGSRAPIPQWIGGLTKLIHELIRANTTPPTGYGACGWVKLGGVSRGGWDCGILPTRPSSNPHRGALYSGARDFVCWLDGGILLDRR